MAKVVQLQPTAALRTPIGHAIRTGEASYRRLEDLHAEGRLPARAVIVERDRFDARSWHRPQRQPTADRSFGRPIHLPLPGLDKSFRKRDFRAITSTARGRRLVACGDRECCPRGLTPMLENHRSHIARQKFRAFDALYAVSDARRVYHLINVELRGVERLARDLVHLNVDDGRLNKALSDWRKRIDSITRMFETLSERTRPSPPPLKRRQGPGAPTHRSSA